MGSYKERSSCFGSSHLIIKKHCHDILLMVVVLNILVGLVALYKYMGTDNEWTVEPDRRDKVLAVAVFLFLSACALCWFIMVSLMEQVYLKFFQRKEQQKWQHERRHLIIDRPPSYESCVSTEAIQPPPSYFTVINTIHIV